jgi:alginate production protein
MLWAFVPGAVRSVASAADIFDPEEPPDTKYRLAPFLTFGAEIEVDYAFRGNFDLDHDRDDGVSELSPELSLAWSFDPSPWVQAFLNVTLTGDLVRIEGDDVPGLEQEVAIELKELYVLLGPFLGGFSAQIGRQRFEDERQWLYDQELDAVRLHLERGSVRIELSASRNDLVQENLLGTPEAPPQIDNYMLHGIYRLPKEIELAGYVIARNDPAADRERPVLVGISSRGEPVEDLDYWLELAYAGGRDGATRIQGWGLDLGATYELPARPRPAFTLGVAFGSGDRDPQDGIDRNFRQTGLQENEWDFGGVAEFKYYGEVLNPELSNLAIFTVGLGVRPTETFSLDLVYHYYLQPQASDVLRNAGLDAEPSGRSRRLGSEVDLVVGVVDLFDRIDLRGILGYFFPGEAFPGATGGAWIAVAEMQFRF